VGIIAPLPHRGGFAQKMRKIATFFVQPLILPKNGVKREQDLVASLGTRRQNMAQLPQSPICSFCR
jgi:hypothetical protein